MNMPAKKVCLLNPIESFALSPRTSRFVRAVGAIEGTSLITIGIGPGLSADGSHLDITSHSTNTGIFSRFTRLVRFFFFTMAALLRLHPITERLHSPNRTMRSNFKIKQEVKRFLDYHRPDVVIARDIYSLPLLKGLVHPSKLWIDLPDFTAEVSTYRPHLRVLLGPYFLHLTTSLHLRAQTFSTVSNSLSDFFERQFKIGSLVVRNALPFHPRFLLEDGLSQPRDSSLGDSGCRLVYVGAAIRRRGIEICIRSIRELPMDFSLDLYLVPTDPGYLQELIVNTALDERIRVVPPVDPNSLVTTIASYSGSLVVIPTNSINSSCALPNKFFQSLQARLPIITGPSLEIESLVKQHDIGEVASSFDPQDIAAACARLTENRISVIKGNLDNAALALAEEGDLDKIRQRLMSMFLRT